DGLHYVAGLFVCVESMQADVYVGNATLGRIVGSQRRCSWLVGQVAESRASLNPMNTAKFGDSSGVPGKLRPKRALVDVFYVDDVDTSIHDRSRFFVRYGTNQNQHGSFPRLDRNLSNALVSAVGAASCLTALWAPRK